MRLEKDGNIQEELRKPQGNVTKKKKALVGVSGFSELRHRLEEVQSIWESAQLETTSL